MSRPVPITDPLALAWIEHQEREHVPPNTVLRRTATLRSIGNAGEATRDEIEAWWATRRDHAAATRSNDLACLRSFYRWCDPLGAPRRRPDEPDRRTQGREGPPLIRPVEDRPADAARGTLPPDLTRAVALGAYAGLRVSEVAALHWDDVDMEARRARVLHGKGGRSSGLLPSAPSSSTTSCPTPVATSSPAPARPLSAASCSGGSTVPSKWPASTRPSTNSDTATAPWPIKRPATSWRSGDRWGIRRRLLP